MALKKFPMRCRKADASVFDSIPIGRSRTAHLPVPERPRPELAICIVATGVAGGSATGRSPTRPPPPSLDLLPAEEPRRKTQRGHRVQREQTGVKQGCSADLSGEQRRAKD